MCSLFVTNTILLVAVPVLLPLPFLVLVRVYQHVALQDLVHLLLQRRHVVVVQLVHVHVGVQRLEEEAEQVVVHGHVVVHAHSLQLLLQLRLHLVALRVRHHLVHVELGQVVREV